ncbi:MAG: type IV toxin-antitoxin system AbiEi family antitoxin domain-containing protein [Actinomycetota bacterium]
MSDRRDAKPTPEAPIQRLAKIARAQHGVFTRAQALASGFNARMIDRRVMSGVWERAHPGVYRLGGAPVTWRQMLLATCLAAGPEAVASLRSAAVVWGLPGFAPGRFELSVPRSGRRARAGSVHHPRALPAIDVTEVDGIPVTTPARTLVDIAGIVAADVVEEALDDALRRGIVTIAQVRRRTRDLDARGRPGSGVLAKLLDARAGPAEVPQSVFETRLLRALRKAGLPKPAVQHEVRTPRGRAVLDFAYPEPRVAIEADGFRWHSSRQQWDHDRARRNALTALGWTVIHVTWPELRDHPGEVVRLIHGTITRARN